MKQTLEQKLQREVGATLRCLAPESHQRLPKPSIKFVETDDPKYSGGLQLLLPQSITQENQADKDIKLGKGAGLFMLYHLNPALRPLFDKEDSREYDFWSNQAMIYAGLVVLALKYGAHTANQHANECRQLLRNMESVDLNSDAEHCKAYAIAVGVDYAAQLYLKHGPQKLLDVLALSNIHDVHARVHPAEDFALFIAKDW